MKPEELMERMDDTELVLSQQDKRITELENKEVVLPQIHTPDLQAGVRGTEEPCYAGLKAAR